MAKRRMMAALAAVATLACGLAGPAAQADELSDLKEAAAQARNAYDEAVSERDALKPARDKAQAVLDEGTIGYFKARGATDAVRILNDDGTLTGHDYASDIRKMKAEGDSETDLDAMLSGLWAIRCMNEFRAEEGTSPKVENYPDRGGKPLKPLLVTDGLMAIAEAHGDRNRVDSDGLTHYMDFSNEAENICGADEDDMFACYYGEKEQFNGVNSKGAGHYLNIVNDELQYAGSGDLVQDFSMENDTFYVTQKQYWDNIFSQGRTLTVDDYEADVRAYKAPYDKAVSDYDTAAKAADEAKAAYKRAEQAVSDYNNAGFTVTFDADGGSAVQAQKVRRGSTATRPADPVRDGYTFQGWYKGDTKYDFSTPVNADVALTARWKAVSKPKSKTFTVSFDAAGGSKVQSQKVTEGQKAARPADPAKKGFAFDGWYRGDAKYDFSAPVTADLTLTAHWSPVFSDVTADTPHSADISWTASTGIAKGWGEADGTRTFRGMDTVKRQDMAAFLRRLAVRMGVAGADSWKPTAADWSRFPDVDKSTPHAEDVLWLAHAGVAYGYREADGSWRFSGLTPVYRQDMAAFLHRLARLAGRGSGVASTRFADVTDSTPHAADIRWLGGTGIAKGYAGGTFSGMTPTYRQDMAAFLHRTDQLG